MTSFSRFGLPAVSQRCAGSEDASLASSLLLVRLLDEEEWLR